MICLVLRIVRTACCYHVSTRSLPCSSHHSHWCPLISAPRGARSAIPRKARRAHRLSPWYLCMHNRTRPSILPPVRFASALHDSAVQRSSRSGLHERNSRYRSNGISRKLLQRIEPRSRARCIQEQRPAWTRSRSFARDVRVLGMGTDSMLCPRRWINALYLGRHGLACPQ
jgi:hypothetical protein